jgi:hypothetical protein
MSWMTSMRFNPPRVVECENGPFETEAEAWRWLHVRWSLRAKAAQREAEYATRMSIIAMKWERLEQEKEKHGNQERDRRTLTDGDNYYE